MCGHLEGVGDALYYAGGDDVLHGDFMTGACGDEEA